MIASNQNNQLRLLTRELIFYFFCCTRVLSLSLDRIILFTESILCSRHWSGLMSHFQVARHRLEPLVTSGDQRHGRPGVDPKLGKCSRALSLFRIAAFVFACNGHINCAGLGPSMLVYVCSCNPRQPSHLCHFTKTASSRTYNRRQPAIGHMPAT